MDLDSGEQHHAWNLEDSGEGQQGRGLRLEGDGVPGAMTEKAVIDRFEDGWAVLLVGEEERRLSVPRKQLPRGVREGHWLQVELEGDTLLSATIDQEGTAQARKRIAEKLARLRRGDHLS